MLKPRLTPIKQKGWLFWLLGGCGICICLFLIYHFRDPLLILWNSLRELLMDREQVADYVRSFGAGAPLAFMGVQILQVILAPIPGEATGFIGGYLFGAFTGCFYSTIALTIGSWLNFCIGRFLGTRWVRRIISRPKLEKYDYLVRHQGMLVIFVLFLFPGFPKDYLCLLLGVTTIPMRVFLIMTFVGRIPGTLMLSLQGALVFEKNYFILSVILVVNLIVVYYAYKYRETVYKWVEKMNGSPPAGIDEDEH